MKPFFDRQILFLHFFVFLTFSINAQNEIQVEFEIEASCFNRINTINLSYPINENIHFTWTVIKTNLEPELIFSTPEVEPIFHLTPGNYDIKLIGWTESNDTVYSDAATKSIIIQENEEIQISSSDIIICSNSKSVHTVHQGSFIKCQWLISDREYVKDFIGIDDFTLEIDWDKAPVSQELEIKAIVTDENNCEYVEKTSLLLLPNEIPEAIEIIRKSENSHILVCILNNNNIVDPSLVFEWGIEEKGNDGAINTLETIHPYLNFDSVFNHKIDTNNFRYFVNIRKKGFYVCKNTIVYNPASKRKHQINSIEKDYDLVLFPNPSNGDLTVSTIVPEEGAYQIIVLNEYGQAVHESKKQHFDSNENVNINISLQHLNKGVYIVGFIETKTKMGRFQKLIIN